MTNATKKPGGWSAVRPHLATWDKPALLALVKDLYAAAEVSRDLVDARCEPGESSGATLEKFMLRYDPAADFQRVKCPVLALNGQLDTQILAAQNLPAIE